VSAVVNPVAAQPVPFIVPRRVRPFRVVSRLVVAALAGACVVLQVRGWTALSVEAGGACGSRYGACPQGTFPVLVISLILGIATVPLTIAGLLRRPRWLSLLMVPALVGGGFAGERAFHFFHGATLSQTWSAGFDNPDTLTTQGVWTTSDTVIRLRTDQISAYAAATGAVRWTYPVPGQNEICTASRGTADGVAVFGYGIEEQPCAHLVALDRTTGRPLWTMKADLQDSFQSDDPDLVAAAGTVVAVRSDAGVTAFNARTGAREWQAPSAPDCVDGFVGADPADIVAIATCDQSYVVADLDPGTGLPRWQTPVEEPATNYELALLSTNPVVVDDRLPGDRGTDHLRAFTTRGRQDVTIDASDVATGDGAASLDTDGHTGAGFGAQPLYWTLVFGNTLVATTRDAQGQAHLLGYDLGTGRRRWDTPTGDEVSALGRSGNSVLVLADSVPSPQLATVDATTGASTAVGVLPGWAFGNDDTGIYQFGARYVVVNENGINPTPPVFCFGR
jgi:outer membrane protein assembly factor BamB